MLWTTCSKCDKRLNLESRSRFDVSQLKSFGRVQSVFKIFNWLQQLSRERNRSRIEKFRFRPEFNERYFRVRTNECAHTASVCFSNTTTAIEREYHLEKLNSPVSSEERASACHPADPGSNDARVQYFFLIFLFQIFFFFCIRLFKWKWLWNLVLYFSNNV